MKQKQTILDHAQDSEFVELIELHQPDLAPANEPICDDTEQVVPDADVATVAESPEPSVVQSGINQAHLDLLFPLFDASYYCAQAEQREISIDDAWNDFSTLGLQENLSPCVAIDIAFIKQSLEQMLEREIGSDEVVLLLWAEHAAHLIPGTDWFDEPFYLSTYPDVAQSGSNAFIHYASHGHREGRMPNAYCLALANRSLTASPDEPIDVMKLIASVPERFRSTFMSGEHDLELVRFFMPDLYQAQRNSKDRSESNLLLAHYLCHGWQEGWRPSVLWHENWYRQRLAERQQGAVVLEPVYAINGKCPSTGSVRKRPITRQHHVITTSEKGMADFSSYGDLDSEDEIDFSADGDFREHLYIRSGVNPYLHWFFAGREMNVVPTPLFDTEFYCLSHRDILTDWSHNPFEHYLHHGHNDPYRYPSQYFNGGHYLAYNDIQTKKIPLLHYVLEGQFDNASASPELDCHHFTASRPLQSSVLEETVLHIAARVERLNHGVLADMINRATRLEPQIVRPYDDRRIRMAPVLHSEVGLMLETRKILQALPETRYDTIVLVPHVRMAGSARIAGKLTQTLTGICGSGRVLVITTDSSVFERPEWFGNEADIFDISRFIDKAPHNRKVRALLDLVRGVKAKRLVNLNSNLGWHLTSLYGRQLSAWTELYVYLFCWDKDLRGNKGGYPIQWFLPTFDYCSAVFTDSEDLRDELHMRYCISAEQRSRIKTLHTPAEDTDIEYNTLLQNRLSNRGVKRVFWSGRFDRQKRFDLLLGIARSLPDIEFWVWGKPVLDDEDIHTTELPKNMLLMGAYSSIDDVPIASCDLFLYTAGWDGLPTVLIEVGSRGIPVVASAVGGVTDLINDQTGWPIVDVDDVGSYCDAIQSVLSNYPAALERSASLRSHTLSLCDQNQYRETVTQAFALESHEH